MRRASDYRVISSCIVVFDELFHLSRCFVDGCKVILLKEFGLQGLEVGFDVAVLPGGSFPDIFVMYAISFQPGVECLAGEAAVVVCFYCLRFPIGGYEPFACGNDVACVE